MMRTTLFLLAIMISGMCSASVYEIYKNEGITILRERYTGKIMHENAVDSEVFEHALELLSNDNGGRLDIGTGEFTLDRSLVAGNNVTLAGQGKHTKLLFTGQADNGTGILIKDVQDVEIVDLMILSRDQNVRAGIVVDNSGSCHIRDSKIIGFSEHGVIFRNNTFFSTVEGCELGGNLISNILLEELAKEGKYGDFLPNTISNNMIVGGGKGIETKRAIVANIIGCTIYQTGDVGIHLHSISNSVLISGCRTFQIGGHAVLVEDSDELNVSSNIFCWHTGSGIVVKNSAWGTISANEFIDNGSYNPGVLNNTITFDEVSEPIELKDGVVLNNVSGFSVGNNAIFNWGVCPPMDNGIVEDASSYQNIISNNTINYYENQAIDARGSESVIKDNTFKAYVPYTQLKHVANKDSVRQGRVNVIQSFDRSMIEEYLENH
jgi:parallel beta-helix repeat protein